MNAVEIEEAITHLAEQPFDAQEFLFAFLEAFGNKKTTIKRLKTGSSNSSDIVGGEGEVDHTLEQLKASAATRKAKAKFVRKPLPRVKRSPVPTPTRKKTKPT